MTEVQSRTTRNFRQEERKQHGGLNSFSLNNLEPMETKLRSLIKAISYRALGSLATSFVVLVVTNKVTLAISVGILDSVVKVFAYFIHERLWARISFGRIEQPLGEKIRVPVDAQDAISREIIQPQIAQIPQRP
jgi:uncharacterized membrane protein